MTALAGIPLVRQGDDLSALILAALAATDVMLQAGDVLVVTSKIVSKAEGRRVCLDDVQPGDEANRYAQITGKDPRLVELVLRESRMVSRVRENVMVVEHRLGFVSANAGIDQSNTEDGDNYVLLLPVDPDGTAGRIRRELRKAADVDIAVIISDSHGRPFRLGTVGAAVGVAGMPALLDLRGQQDLFGRTLRVSVQGYADMVASAATLAAGEGAEGYPVVLVRGLRFPPLEGRAADLNRPPADDLYR